MLRKADGLAMAGFRSGTHFRYIDFSKLVTKWIMISLLQTFDDSIISTARPKGSIICSCCSFLIDEKRTNN